MKFCGYCLFPLRGKRCDDCATTWPVPMSFDEAKAHAMDLDRRMAEEREDVS